LVLWADVDSEEEVAISSQVFDPIPSRLILGFSKGSNLSTSDIIDLIITVNLLLRELTLGFLLLLLVHVSFILHFILSKSH